MTGVDAASLYPLEAEEQSAVVELLETLGLVFSATAQSTYTKSPKQKRTNYKLGVRPGLPDLIIHVPSQMSVTGLSTIIFLEMKRQLRSLSKVSDGQRAWLAAANSSGCVGLLAYGAGDAAEQLSKYIRVLGNEKDRMGGR